MEGNTDPDYEVIPSKTQKGKYTVRRRKVSLPANEDIQKSETPPSPEPVEEQADTGERQEDSEEIPDYPFRGYNPYMINDYQMMLNKMMIEQMKMLRQEVKHSQKKQQKLKGKSQKIYDILADAVNGAPPREEAPPPPQPDIQRPIPVDDNEEEEYGEEDDTEPTNTINYFEKDYKNTTPIKKVERVEPVPEPETPKYKQDYEKKIDEMGGFVILPSRRDRLNFKNFNI